MMFSNLAVEFEPIIVTEDLDPKKELRRELQLASLMSFIKL